MPMSSLTIKRAIASPQATMLPPAMYLMVWLIVEYIQCVKLPIRSISSRKAVISTQTQEDNRKYALQDLVRYLGAHP